MAKGFSNLNINTRANFHNGSIKIQISGKRIQQNLVKSQLYLDGQVLEDSNKYVPFRSGELRRSGIRNTVIGSGEVKWAILYAHYQHKGKDMVGTMTKRHWAMRGEPKEYNGRALEYHTPDTGSHWFEKAKRIHGKSWVKKVKKIAGGG